MKLYTEEQVRKAISEAMFCHDIVDAHIAKLTPIELPSDEEVKEKTFEYIEPPKQYPCNSDGYNEYDMFVSFNKGAKWVIDKIKNQQQ